MSTFTPTYIHTYTYIHGGLLIFNFFIDFNRLATLWIVVVYIKRCNIDACARKVLPWKL